MSWLPKRDKLDPVQASAIDFAVAQEGRRRWRKYVEVEMLCLGRGSRPCYQIAAVADGLLCGMVGQIVVRLKENCKRLVGYEFDRAGVGCGLA